MPEKDFGGCDNQRGDTGRAVGNPCDAATGNKYEIDIDLSGGQGFPTVTRYFNSLLAQNVGLSERWTNTLIGRSLVIETDRIQVRQANGRRESFTRQGDGSWRGDGDTRLSLIEDAEGYLLKQRDGASERYDTTGKLLTETDRAGLQTVYQYDGYNRLATVTGPFGHALAFIHDGRLFSKIIDPAGWEIIHDYDDPGVRLFRVRYPDGTGTYYHYESNTSPYAITGISYIATNNALTRYSTYGYDNTTRKAVLTEHARTVNPVGQERFTLTYDSDTQTTVRDAINTTEVMTFETHLGVKNLVAKLNQWDGKTLTQKFDANNNLICKKDEEGRVTTYGYNATNQRISMTEGLSGDCSNPPSSTVSTPVTRTTTYQYLSPTLDLPTVIESPSVYAGQVKRTTIGYGNPALANLPTMITQSGYTPEGAAVARSVALSYNGYGQVKTIDGPRSDVSDVTTLSYYECTTGGRCGQLQSITNALNQVTSFNTYDALGRLTKLTDPNGLVTEYQYDPRGRVRFITQTPPQGVVRVTEYRYNAAGNVTYTAFPDARTLTYTYNAAQELTKVTDNLGNYVLYGYDNKGNRTTEETFDSSGTLVRTLTQGYDPRNRLQTLNAAGSLTQLINDAVGNLTQVTDAKANPPTQHQYDQLNRLYQTLDAIGGVTGYQHDIGDRIKSVTAPNSAVTQYHYDDLGNLLKETSTDRGTTTYTHDPAGNVKTKTVTRASWLSITAAHTYDAANRLIAITYPTSSENVTFVYDSGALCSFGVGRLCRVSDDSGVTEYGYDSFGNITTHQKTELGVSYLTQYTHDAADRVIGITYPGGRQVNIGRDGLGRVRAVNTTVNGTSVNVLSNVGYRPDGLASSLAWGNGLTETRVHNLKGELNEQYLGSLGTRLYDYDLNGNLDRLQTLPAVYDPGYDALDRLTQQSTNGAAAQLWSYDANGNRLSDPQKTLNYSPQSNRLTQAGVWVVGSWLDGSITLRRVDNGEFGAVNYVYSYNDAGRMHRSSYTVTFPDGRVYDNPVDYRYNVLGLRTRKTKAPTTAPETTVFHYDEAGRLIEETNESGGLKKSYVYLDATPIAQIDKDPQTGLETLTYIHTDHQGTPRIATDAAQRLVWRIDGDPFGNNFPYEDVDGDGKKTHIHLRFPGQYYDAETMLHYNWHRYYDPYLGRYLTYDPIGLDGGLNPFVYAENNPLLYFDFEGLTAGVRNKKGVVRPDPRTVIATLCLAKCIDVIITITEGTRTQEQHDRLRKKNPKLKNRTSNHIPLPGGNLGRAVDVRGIANRTDQKILCCAVDCGFTRAKKYSDDGHWHFDMQPANGWGETMPSKGECCQ